MFCLGGGRWRERRGNGGLFYEKLSQKLKDNFSSPFLSLNVHTPREITSVTVASGSHSNVIPSRDDFAELVSDLGGYCVCFEHRKKRKNGF